MEKLKRLSSSLLVALVLAQILTTTLVMFFPVIGGKYTMDSVGLISLALVLALFIPVHLVRRHFATKRK